MLGLIMSVINSIDKIVFDIFCLLGILPLEEAMGRPVHILNLGLHKGITYNIIV